MRTLVLPFLLLLSCQPAGNDGAQGPPGEQGPPGPMGAMGVPGKDGTGALPAALGRSGSRLKFRATYLAMEDGATIGAERIVWDTKLDVACTIRKAEDATMRCLPREDLPLKQGGYIDAACTRQIVGLTAGSATPKYWAEASAGGYRFYRFASAKIVAPTKYYASGDDGMGNRCFIWPTPPDATLDWYEPRGAAVAPGEFVAAESKTILE